MGFQFGTRLGNGVGDAVEDMLTTGLSLHESLFEDVERQAVALDIHLGGCQTVASTGGLEVHIAQVVLVAEDIAQDGVFVFSGVLDETHGNTRDGLLHRNASVHQGECAGADRSH